MRTPDTEDKCVPAELGLRSNQRLEFTGEQHLVTSKGQLSLNIKPNRFYHHLAKEFPAVVYMLHLCDLHTPEKFKII